MCQMWQKIRFGVRWNPHIRLSLATRGINLKNVKSIDISMDPFHQDNNAIRYFWNAVTTPRIRMTNPQTKVNATIRNDRQPPYILAHLADGKKLLFETENMPPADLVMRFNKLLGNPQFGKSGIRPRTVL